MADPDNELGQCVQQVKVGIRASSVDERRNWGEMREGRFIRSIVGSPAIGAVSLAILKMASSWLIAY